MHITDWSKMYRRSPIGNASSGSVGFQRIWLLWLSLGFISYGILLLLGQITYWLRQSEWVALPSLYLFVPFELPRRMGVGGFIPSWFVGNWPWLESPSSWYGLHKVIYGTLESFSIPGVSFILAIVFFFVGLSGDQRRVTVPNPNPDREENRDGT